LLRDVTVVPEGTPSSAALDIIKDKKEDNVVVCNAEGNFVGTLASLPDAVMITWLRSAFVTCKGWD
jgi:hypothetical protein